MRPKIGVEWYVFKRESGRYVCECEPAIRWGDYSMHPTEGEESHFQYFKEKAYFSTVAENMSHFTEDGNRRAAEARMFMGRMGSGN